MRRARHRVTWSAPFSASERSSATHAEHARSGSIGQYSPSWWKGTDLPSRGGESGEDVAMGVRGRAVEELFPVDGRYGMPNPTAVVPRRSRL